MVKFSAKYVNMGLGQKQEFECACMNMAWTPLLGLEFYMGEGFVVASVFDQNHHVPSHPLHSHVLVCSFIESQELKKSKNKSEGWNYEWFIFLERIQKLDRRDTKAQAGK